MELPQRVRRILSVLSSGGYRGYLVGGCVRDACMGKAPHDFDLATDATPEEMRQVFRDFRLIETGIRHGTLTVLIDHEPFEVTTFRIDGAYPDHRHPDSVTFTRRIEDDLARRDFTVNAMAYDGSALVDPFGGVRDVRDKVLRAVGDAQVRFDEDGLRILRALRFAAVLGFSIEPDTAKAVRQCRELLRKIAVERLYAEMRKLLSGENAAAVLTEFADVIRVFLPELSETGLRAVEKTQPDGLLRLALLLEGADAETVLRRLHADRRTIRRVCLLHTLPLTDARHLLAAAAEDAYRAVGYAAALGRIDTQRQAQFCRELDALLAEKPCLSLRELAVNGSDLSALGYAGREIGQMLDALLEQVLSGRLPNEREALLGFAAGTAHVHPDNAALAAEQKSGQNTDT